MEPYGLDATYGYQQILLLLELGVCGIRDNIEGSKQQQCPLFRIMAKSRSADATDDRDRVFALLNVCTDQKQLGLEPDYVASYTEVCHRVAQSLVRAGYGPGIISIKSHMETKVELPSWVPDWSLKAPPMMTTAPDPDVVNAIRLGLSYSAGGKTHDIRLGNNCTELLLEAYKIDGLVASNEAHQHEKELPAHSPDVDFDRDHEFFCLLANLNDTKSSITAPSSDPSFSETKAGERCINEATAAFKDEFHMFRTARRHLADAKSWVETSPRYRHCDRMEILWRTFTNNQELGSQYQAPAYYQKYCRAYYDLAERFSSPASENHNSGAEWTRQAGLDDPSVQDGLTAPMPKEMDEQIKQAVVFVRAVTQWAHRPRPALTRSGFVFMVPLAARPGDVVFVVKGVPAPVALRPVHDIAQSRPPRYELLGPCYCHGFMDGEVLASDEYQQEDIVLV